MWHIYLTGPQLIFSWLSSNDEYKVTQRRKVLKITKTQPFLMFFPLRSGIWSGYDMNWEGGWLKCTPQRFECIKEKVWRPCFALPGVQGLLGFYFDQHWRKIWDAPILTFKDEQKTSQYSGFGANLTNCFENWLSKHIF